MKLVINIPEEFEEHFNKDRFSDSLARVASDIESFGFQLAGRYEQETITMIRKAFEDATPLESQTCENINEDYAECDQFQCSECHIELQDWHRVERDDDDGDITYHEYTFRYCPNCGRRVKQNEIN